jgi:photosystem II stability/assembly factor-like uncharacterized protein
MQDSSFPYPVLSSYFIDSQTGWIGIGGGSFSSSYGIIKRTGNGGNNWLTQKESGLKFMSIHFLNSNTGWAAGYAYDDIGYHETEILKTTNSGTNWLAVFTDTSASVSVYSVNFANNVGYCSGSYGLIMKSTDYGETWTTQAPVTNLYLYCIRTIDGINCWAGGGTSSEGVLLKSTNGGSNWTVNSSYGSQINAIQFLNSQTGWITCSNGYIYKTVNAGTNWSSQFPGTNNTTSIHMLTADMGWVTTSSSIYRTSNSGLNWILQPLPSHSSFYCIYMVDSLTGWAGGGYSAMFNSSGFILKTTNGGNPIGIKPISSDIPKEFRLCQNYPNPFNPSTSITFDIKRTSYTRLSVFDALGREVGVPVDEVLEPGNYKITFDGSRLSSGIYFYRLSSNDFSDTKKMILLK